MIAHLGDTEHQGGETLPEESINSLFVVQQTYKGN
jgi:hypothetical protein